MLNNTILGGHKKKVLAGVVVGAMIVTSFAIAATSCNATTAEADTVILYENDEILTAMAEKAKGVKEYNDYKEGEYQTVTLKGDSIEFNGTGAAVNGSDLVITEAGTYVISGTLNDGAIIVESTAEENVVLVLENADITCKDGAPIYVKECGKNVVISVPEGSTSVLTDGEEYTYEYVEEKTDEETGEVSLQPSGAVFSKADLRMNGSGTLTVNSNNNDGITSKDDVEIAQINLIVNAADDGIVGKDCVAVRSGSITVTATGDGIKSTNSEDEAKGYIAVADGTFNITSGQDGMQAETVLMTLGGEFNIKTGVGYADALAAKKVENPMGDMGGFGGGKGGFGRQQNQTADSGTQMQTPNTENGTQPSEFKGTNAQTANGERPTPPSGQQTANSSQMSEPPAKPEGDMQTPPSGGQMPNGQMPSGGTQTPPDGQQMPNGTGEMPMMGNPMADMDSNLDADDTNTTSIKALKAGTKLLIQDGTFNIDSEDDALHSDGYLAIAETTMTVSSGDDGIHADEKIDIYAGTITVANSYEGLEGKEIVIHGGSVDITASDDGINVSGDTAETDSDTSYTFTVNDGEVKVNADGDGIDVNGNGYITGGTVIVEGPTNSGNGGLDYERMFEVTGGTLIVTGSQGMAMAPSDGTTVNTVATAVETQAAGTEITLVDSDGNVIMTVTPEKEFSHIVISSNEIQTGESYKIMAGNTELASFTADETITNLSGGMGGFGGGFGGGGRGGFDGQQPPAAPTDMTNNQ